MFDAVSEALADAANEGLIDLQSLRTQCLAKLLEGGGEVTFILNASLNGKMAAQQCRRDATELLTIVNRAIALSNGTAVTLTYVDFSGLR